MNTENAPMPQMQELEAVVGYVGTGRNGFREQAWFVLPIAGSPQDAEALAEAVKDRAFVPEDLGLEPLAAQTEDGAAPPGSRNCEISGMRVIPADRTPSMWGFEAHADARTFEEFVAGFMLLDAGNGWHEYDRPAGESYSGPGWQAPSADEVAACMERALQDAEGASPAP